MNCLMLKSSIKFCLKKKVHNHNKFLSNVAQQQPNLSDIIYRRNKTLPMWCTSTTNNFKMYYYSPVMEKPMSISLAYRGGRPLCHAPPPSDPKNEKM